jgi:endonuclease YncB( thermonuclease family)
MKLESYGTPHLWGTVDYTNPGRLMPDGDTIHLRDPVLVMMGRVFKPEGGVIEVPMPGRSRPHVLTLRGDPPGYLPIRLSGIDAPESHYVASVRPDPYRPAYQVRESRHKSVCQPHHEHALAYILRVVARWPKVIVELDREVIDKRERVLGFLYASTDRAERKTFITQQLVRRGLAFPFVFESLGDYRPRFLEAGAKAKRERLGVWKHYVDTPLAYTKSAWAAVDTRSGAVVPRGSLNHPMIFRRVVEAGQLKGFDLKAALRKYDCFHDRTGDIYPGDAYQRVPVEARVWAAHQA